MNDSPAREAAEADSMRERVRREHQHLHRLTVTIVETTDLASLPALLREFRETLVAHHALDEADDGLFDSIRAEAPHLSHRVAEMQREHAEFVARLDELLPGASDQTSRDETHRAVTELIERMREHDAEENALLLDSVETDIGGCG